MKQGLSFILVFISIQLNGQNSETSRYEQKALDYFTDSIASQLKDYRIITDANISNTLVNTDYVWRLIDDFYFGIFQKYKDSGIYRKYWSEYERLSKAAIDSSTPVPIDSTKNIIEKLRVNKPIMERNRVIYRESKGGFIRYHGKKISNFFFRERLILTVKEKVYFDKLYWVKISLVSPDSEFGRDYILRFNEDGSLVDYSSTAWIS